MSQSDQRMRFGSTFWSLSGEMDRKQFRDALAVLFLTMMGLSLLVAKVSLVFGVLGTVMVIPYLCVFGKRFKHADKSVWLFVPFLFGFFVLLLAARSLGTILFARHVPRLQFELTEILSYAAPAEARQVYNELMPLINHGMILPNVLALITVHLALGWAAYRFEPGLRDERMSELDIKRTAEPRF